MSTQMNKAPEMNDTNRAFARTMLAEIVSTFTPDDCVESLLGVEADATAEHPELFNEAYLNRIQAAFPSVFKESLNVAEEFGISRLDALVVLAAEAKM